ncbi:peptidase inhibitor 16 [Orycteropus afer afer]|uniref:Peptidase inhibitor 16 n=1 Tax=Orycteropus afer afer TaxID=1230840 RepID=A0AC54Z9B5_ORYAF|nr:peptidase inhibitor 16 [Orycteropus afer afer]
MHSSHSLLLFLLLLLLLATAGPAGALTEEEKRLTVEAHNFYRAQTNPPAANMLKMLWDEDLAIFAKGYAKQCIWAHNPNRGWRGENLFAITGDSMDVQMAVAEWHRERDYYNFSTGTCQPGQMCGHYTQVVWAKSDRIGCDSHLCTKLQNVDDSNVHFLVCNYAPPGNVRRQKLYEVGPPCSACPKGYHCEQNLCEPITGPEEPQDLPCLVTEAQTSLATEALGSSKTDAPSSLTTEAPFFLVTEIPASLPTKALPTVQTETRSSLTTKDSLSIAAESPLSLTEVPSFLATHSLFSLDKRPITSPKSTYAPLPELADKTSKRSTPTMSSEISLDPKMSLTRKQKPLSHAQEKVEARGPHELPLPGEVLASVLPAQDEPDELQTTLVHMGHTTSRSLPNSPNTSATANAIGGRTSALQSSLPAADLPGESVTESGLNPNPTGPNPAGPSPAGPNPNPAKPNPTKPNPARPNPAGPNPAKPNPAKPNPAGPNPAKPNPAGPNPAKPNPAGPNQGKPNPAAGPNTPELPSPAGPSPAGPNWAEQNPAKPSLEGPSPAEPSLEELEESNPAETEELNPEEVELPEQEEPNVEETNGEEPNAEEPNAEQPNAEQPNAEHPNVEEPNAEEPNAEHPSVEEPNAEDPNAEDPNAEEPNAEEQQKPTGPTPTRPTKWKPTKTMIHIKPKPSRFNSASDCVWNPLLRLLVLLPLVVSGLF